MNVDLGKINKELSEEINRLQGENNRLIKENKSLKQELSIHGNGKYIPLSISKTIGMTKIGKTKRAKRMKPDEVFEIVKPYLERKKMSRNDIEKIPGITFSQFENMLSKYRSDIDISKLGRKNLYSINKI